MQTHFTLAQLADPDIAEANGILRACVHCGFCTATCPTYVLLGDELDSPRGRIYLIKGMLESDAPASAQVTKHIDRCLTCLSCMTTCPSGVHYQHLVDQARVHIEKTYRRPFLDRVARGLLARIIPYPRRFRLALIAGALARPFGRILPARLGAMLALSPASVPRPSSLSRSRVHAADGVRKGRVAMLAGCAQSVLGPHINDATIRVLTRHGIEVVVAKGTDCCGSLVHHMGRESQAHAQARAAIAGWIAEMDGEGLDAIVINASGCGTMVKDYGFIFRNDAALAADAGRVSAIAQDISEYLAEKGLMAPVRATGQTVAYHAACSLQHGQKITEAPKQLLRQAGFEVVEPRDSHLCCGSAGTYNMLQPELASRLKARKVENLRRTEPDLVSAGNLGCIAQLGADIGVPVVHTVELLDWATGGPAPGGTGKILEGVR
jgi:glycolate oxidase iron-sulfur subunit